MTEFQKIFRIWIVSTIFFIVISAIVAGGMVLYRLVKFENETKQIYVTLLDAQIEKSLPKLAEETYLGLGTSDVRQKELQEFLGSAGEISLQISPKDAAGVRTDVTNLPQISNEKTLYYPLLFGDLNLGKLKVSVIWRDSLNVSLGNSIFPLVGLLVGILVVFWLGFFFFIRKKALQPLLARVVSLERSGAIAKTTQMLAHDIRKPFSMFRMIIDTVEGEDDPIEAKQLLKESLPEVQQAMASVNGMISDVLEIGSESAPIAEPTNPETLIEATLNEIFRVYPESKVNIIYGLSHKHKVNVDTLKIGRVFSNSVGNAVQAMNQKGDIWFKTVELEENGKPFVKFCLGNGGSVIPPESLSKLFDAFFTSGKKGGTGLGLAIAQKIITAHGGKIWCESDVQRGVEFFFTLPCANELCDARQMPLPASSAVITSTFERLRKASNGGGRVEADPLEVTLEKEIIKLAKAAKAPLKILVVDDEGVYRNSLAALINRSNDLKEHVALLFAKNSHEALDGVAASPALIIQDVDLGVNSLSGYEVLKTLRAQGYGGVVCIHSNRTSPDDYKVAVDAGADAVLPKPMSRTHFLKLMLQAAERMSNKVALDSAKAVLPEFALLDDSRLTLRAWQRKIGKDAVVHVFTSPNEFRAHVDANKDFLARLGFVVTDFYFAEGVLDTGFTFAESLRPNFAKPILLCSDGDFTPEIIKGHVDAVISKDPEPWSELSSKVMKIAKTS